MVCPLDYEPLPTPPRSQTRGGVFSIKLLIAYLLLFPYLAAMANSSGRQAHLPVFALMVLSLSAVAFVVAVTGLFQGGKRSFAIVALLLHPAVAMATVVYLGMLA